jgi:hypothetical protein
MGRMAALRSIQREVRGPMLAAGGSVVDELIADRRAEAAREEAEARDAREDGRRPRNRKPAA